MADVTVRSNRDGLDPDEVGGTCNRRRSAGSARYASPGRRMDSTAWPNGCWRTPVTSRDDSTGPDCDHGTAERADHSGFPTGGGPAVPEREIGPGGVSGCSAMPESEKVQPARQSSWIQGAGGHHRTSRRPRFRHGEDRPMGAGNPGLQRPRNDRSFPPLEVKAVKSDHPLKSLSKEIVGRGSRFSSCCSHTCLLRASFFSRIAPY